MFVRYGTFITWAVLICFFFLHENTCCGYLLENIMLLVLIRSACQIWHFYHLSCTHMLLFSPWKHMLWVLIRKHYVVGTQLEVLTQALLMSTHKICFIEALPLWKHILWVLIRSACQIWHFYHLSCTHMLLFSPWKHMLWVLIRSASLALLISTHNMCFHGEKRSIWVQLKW